MLHADYPVYRGVVLLRYVNTHNATVGKYASAIGYTNIDVFLGDTVGRHVEVAGSKTLPPPIPMITRERQGPQYREDFRCSRVDPLGPAAAPCLLVTYPEC